MSYLAKIIIISQKTKNETTTINGGCQYEDSCIVLKVLILPLRVLCLVRVGQ